MNLLTAAHVTTWHGCPPLDAPLAVASASAGQQVPYRAGIHLLPCLLFDA